MDKAIFVQAHEKDKNVYFSSLSNYLQKKNISGDHLVFNSIEERIYKELDILNIIYLPKELQIMSDELTMDLKSKYDLDEIVHFTKLFNYSNGYDFDINKYSKLVIKFINYLYKYKSKNQLKLIITWNETFLFDKAAIEFAKVENIPYMLFEEGLFRPNTITVDTKGINYGNSVPNDVKFYKEKIFIKKDNNKQTEKLNSEKKIFNFPKYYFKERVKDYINNNIKKCELNLELKNKPIIAKINDKFKRFTYHFEKDEDIILPSSFIFVPFQVHDDSQIILNSPNIRDMEEMVNFIISSVKKLNENRENKLYVIFKEHPADIGRIDYSKIYRDFSSDYFIFLKKYDTEKLIKQSKLVITVNSTVGIEALKFNKKVITLGNAFYNIEEIVHHCKDITELHEVIKIAENSTLNKELIQNFLNYLRYEYQIEGDWRTGKFNSQQLGKKIKKLRDFD